MTTRHIRDQVTDLADDLGLTVLAALSGAVTRDEPLAWMREPDQVPSAAAADRIRAAGTSWSLVAAADGADIARAWFVGDNPLLGQSPVLALRAGRTADVIAAARSYADRTWAA